MASEQPIPGRCGKKTKTRPGFCTLYPINGRTTCRKHGGGGKLTPAGRPIIHGRFSKRFQGLAEAGRARLEELMNDPELLDVKRPVALATLLAEMGVTTPNEEIVMERARAMTPAGLSVRPETVVLAYQEILLNDAKFVELLGRRQESAARQQRAGAVILGGVLPLMEQFGRRLLDVADRHVPANRQEAFRADVQRIVEILVAEIAAVSENAG